MALNFQDVIRDVHDAPNHALQISGTIQAAGQATVNINGAATLYAVVNTSAAGDSVNNIGFATVAISNPTLYAVVNTGAAGQASVVIDSSINNIGFATVRVGAGSSFIGLTSIQGNVNLNAGVNGIGFATVNVVNQPALVASTANIGSVSVLGGTIGVSSLPALAAGVNGIGFVTVNQVNQPALVASTANIGSVSVLGGSIALSAGLANVGFATVAVSTPTLFAVVNTGAPGTTDVTSDSGVTVYQGDASWTVDNAGLTELAGAIDTEVQVDVVGALPAGNNNIGDVDIASIAAGINYIGFATVNQVNQPALIASSANIGSVSVLGGGIGINAGVNFIGLVTVAPHSLTASTLNIGSVSVLGGTINSVLQASTLNIGSVSILGGSIVNSAGVNGIGFVTAKIDSGTQFIGLVTAWSRNAGTTKTLIPLPVGLGQNSIATVAVPTNANKINLTQLILNSNVTTEIAIKSGVTYLTGNASLGITLMPGGGFVMNGSPDSPAWIGLPSGAVVVEKRDAGGTVSKIGGNVIYFDE